MKHTLCDTSCFKIYSNTLSSIKGKLNDNLEKSLEHHQVQYPTKDGENIYQLHQHASKAKTEVILLLRGHVQMSCIERCEMNYKRYHTRDIFDAKLHLELFKTSVTIIAMFYHVQL